MQPHNYNNTASRGASTEMDAGLRTHFQRVYNIMALGLVVTGFSAYLVSKIPGIENVFITISQNMFLGLAVAAAPMIVMMMMFSPGRMMRSSFQSLVIGFVGFSAFWGALMSVIFLVYSPESIIKTFFITAATFSVMSIIGYTTKRDLSKMGSLLQMAVIGLIIAIVVNVFLQSPMMHIIISGVGVLIYTGLTAWDTQKIKETYAYSHGEEANSKAALMGALSLYINFIMLFQFLLQFLGSRE